MRSIWSYAGLALALLVAAVLIVPGFLDWSRYAGLIEAQAEAVTGRDVTISGDVGIALLPSPTLTLGRMTIANADSGSRDAMLKVEGMRAELSVGSLFRGDLIISRLTMHEPDLLLEVTPDGRSNWQFQPASPAADAGEGDVSQAAAASSGSTVIDALPPISVDEIEVTGGRIGFRNLGIGSDFELAQVEALVAASGLSGPYKARGKAVLAGEPGEFVATLGEVAPDKASQANLSVSFSQAEATFSGIVTGRGADVRFDGAVKAGATTDLSPALGAMTAGQPVALTAGVIASPAGISLRDIEAGAGAVKLTGTLDAQADASVTLAATAAINRIDFTGFETADLPLTTDALVRAAEDIIAGLPAGTYSLAADEIRLPSGKLRDVALEGEAGGETISLSSLSVTLPGDVAGSATGALSMGGEGPYFSGDMTLKGGTPRTLIAWMTEAEVPQVLSRMPLEALDLESGVFLTPKRIGLDKLDLSIDGGSISGQVASSFDARPDVDITLKAEKLALPLEHLPVAGDIVPGQAIDLGFDGRVALKVAALDVDDVHVENVSLIAEARGTHVTIPEILFRSADGASGTLSGKSSGGVGDYQATLTAPDASALAGVLPLPHAALERVQSLSLSARASWPAEAVPDRAVVGPEQTMALSVLGRVGAVRVVTEALYAAGPNGNADAAYEVSSTLESDHWQDLISTVTAIAGVAGDDGQDAAAAKAQEAGEAKGPHIMTAAIEGVRGAPSVVAVEVATDALMGSAAGTVDLVAKPAIYALDVQAGSDDPAAVAAAAGYRLRDIDTVTFMGGVRFDGEAYSATGMSLAMTGSDGHLDMTIDANVTPADLIEGGAVRPRGTVTLASRQTDLPMLFALLGGHHVTPAAEGNDSDTPDAAPETESRWSTGLLPVGWMTAADLDITVTGENVGAGDLRASELDGTMTLKDGVLTLPQMRAMAFGGEVRSSGSVTAGDGVSLDMSVAGTGLAAGDLVRALGLGEAGTGLADVDFKITGNGLSALALVSSIKGEGSFEVVDGALAGVDLAALGDGLVQLDDVADFAPLADATLSSGATSFKTIKGNVAVTSGVVRAPDIALELAAGTGRSAAFADIGRMALDVEARLTPPQPEGAPPVEIVVAGDFTAPERVTNTAALEAFAGRRLLKKEIEELGADPASVRVLLDQPSDGQAAVSTP
ncbi:AsmA family protein [Pyruvatibacter mobilis]|uniref:AsmA family protein n=1 Tax=Pyruvatibacter mobilis TaxID=1712261 RepID=UPI003BABAE39